MPTTSVGMAPVNEFSDHDQSKHCFMHSLVRLLMLAGVLALASARITCGQSAWYEGFEGMDVSWRPASGDVRYRVLEHQRIGGAHTGEKCEWFKISADGGTTLNVAHDVGHPRVIAELLPTVWIRADRPGLWMAANVVFPRTIDPRTNKPLVTTVMGEARYTEVGRWQQLRLTEMPKLVERQVRALRQQLGPNVDEREAYLDAILINVFGGPGVTNVWIDDLDIAGYVSLNASPGGQIVAPYPRIGGATPANMPAIPKRFDIQLSGSMLSVDGWPTFPRAIEHQGEPLARLKELGFNVVWLKQPPSQQMLDDADRLGLWLICPPPPVASALRSAPVAPIGPEFDRVLFWNLGDDLGPEQLAATRRWADQIRDADRRVGRPLICKPQSNLLGYSQIGNNDMTLLVDRRPLGTTMELTDYGTWVSRQPWIAIPGTPMWTTVQTQPNEGLRRQLSALDPSAPPPQCVSYEQVRLLTYTAIAAGSRGLLFLSSSPLDAADPATRDRAMALELLNHYLAMLEPWASGGNYWAKADSSNRQIAATVLRSERVGRLLLPIWSSPGAQCVPGQSAANNVWFVAAVPEGSSAYEMTPGELRRLPSPYQTGGARVTFEEFSLTSQVLLAQNPAAINGLMRRSENIGQRAARLERELAVSKLNAAQAVMGRLGQPPSDIKQLSALVDSASSNLRQCDAALVAKNNPAASLSADRAMRAVRIIERFYWDKAVNSETTRRSGISPATSPATLAFGSLPLQERLRTRIRSSSGPNVLPGGDFEDPNVILGAGLGPGWQNIPNNAQGLDSNGNPLLMTRAELVPSAAHCGTMGLQLSATPSTPETSPLMVEAPPVRFISPTVPAEVGQLVCIHGWVKVPKPITGSVDGLMIYDNQAGEALAERVGETAKWRQFVLYRLVTESGGVNVTFSLTGLGTAMIDDVGIDVLEPIAP
jgi:hypothetical protein